LVTRPQQGLEFEGAYHRIPEGAVGESLVVPFNDLAAFAEAVDRNHDNIACVVLELVSSQTVIPAAPELLNTVRELTRRHGILLIIDETLTAFRGFTGGEQSRVKIVPDLTCLGERSGRGFPLGIYGGRKDLMDGSRRRDS
jgi:glutamate-1-semialdehyde 2,1-aminomutase